VTPWEAFCRAPLSSAAAKASLPACSMRRSEKEKKTDPSEASKVRDSCFDRAGPKGDDDTAGDE
jgi:hypothetical protein